VSHPSALALLLCATLAAFGALAASIDTATSRIGFTLSTRWGQELHGRFPHYQGEIATTADGRHQVRLRLDTADVEIVGHTGYSRLTRGGGFFDAAHYPHIEFVSEAYPPALLRSGGVLRGQLAIRGIARREAFVVQPATCDRPGRDCDVVAIGSIDRSVYGMDRWSFALSREVRFDLRVRVREDAGS